MPRGSGPSVQTVIAAQAGDETAMDNLVSEYLPLIYNIAGRALRGHADVDDVVQETMLRVVRGLRDLRDPAAFRSWLVAVAIRQVRDHQNARQAVVIHDLWPDVADPAADFVDLAILRLGLSGQRRETAEATRWLDVSYQELLALWWLEAGGKLSRSEIAAALGLPPRHLAVRIARMKGQLTTARVLVRALRAAPVCDGLVSAAAEWDHAPSPLWRKRLARHTRDCRQCRAHYDGLVPADRLLADLPLVPVIAGAGRGLLPGTSTPLPAGHRTASGSDGARPGSQLARSGSDHARSGSHHARSGSHPALRRAGRKFGHARFLSKSTGSVPAKIAAVSVVAACAAGGTFAVIHHSSAVPPAALVGVAATSRPVAASSASSAPSPARPQPRPEAPAAGNTKKGVSAWAFGGARKALAESGASWYYTWSSNHDGITSPRGVKFVPMIWGPGSVNAATLSQAESHGHILLGFNEPDMSSQSNMTVPQALRLWPQLIATGMRLGSPAVAADAATPGGWLDRFMQGAAARGYRVNFITVHWYGGDFATGAAVSQLKSYLQAIYARYHFPIWLTEYALANFGTSPASFPTWQQQAAFVTASAAMLDRLRYVHRYAWFALPSTSTDGTVGLFRSGAIPTLAGRAFEVVDAPH
jgi:RNA polymerase sigma factor (sigma-70 family)